MREEDLRFGAQLILDRFRGDRTTWMFLLHAVRLYYDLSIILLAFCCMMRCLFVWAIFPLDYLLTAGTIICVSAERSGWVVLWLPIMAYRVLWLSGWKFFAVLCLWIVLATWFGRKDVIQVMEFLRYEEATGSREPLFFREQIEGGVLKPEDVEPALCRSGPSAQGELVKLWLAKPGLRPAIRRLHGKKERCVRGHPAVPRAGKKSPRNPE